MNAATFLTSIIDPGLSLVQQVGGPKMTDDARRFLMAVALQESRIEHRYQSGSSPALPGPARGWWQFEQGGGVTGVLSHPVTTAWAVSVCQKLAVETVPVCVWRALEGHDILAAAFARLFVVPDPPPLPTSLNDGWNCYDRVWRPGKPRPLDWAGCWQLADIAVQNNPRIP